MSRWAKVGEFLKENAGEGAALVGSLLTGHVAGAVAAGVSIVSSATGSNDPEVALERLNKNPETLVELRRIAHEEQKSIRGHIAEMERLNIDGFKAESGDRANARDAHKHSPMPAVICVMLTLMVAAGGWLLFKMTLPEGNQEIAYMLYGALLAKWGDSIAYWVGTTRSSAEKDRRLK